MKKIRHKDANESKYIWSKLREENEHNRSAEE